MPRFSIIIPVYNAEKNIEKISSQVLDSYKDLELILIDDGSTDNTLHVLNQIRTKDNRARVFSQKNSGPSVARNLGIDKSSGDYIIFMDADDEIIPQSFSKLLSSPITAPLTVLGWLSIVKSKGYSFERKITQKSQIIKQDIIPKTINSLGNDGRMYNLWNKIYESKFIKESNIKLNKDLKFGEDLIFNLEFISRINKIHFDSKDPYYIYEECSPTSVVSSSKLSIKYRKINSEALDKFANMSNQDVKSLAEFVKCRWYISYCIAVCKTKTTLLEKIRLIKDARASLIFHTSFKQSTIKRTAIAVYFKVASYMPFSVLCTIYMTFLLKAILHSRQKKYSRKILVRLPYF